MGYLLKFLKSTIKPHESRYKDTALDKSDTVEDGVVRRHVKI